MKGKYWLTGTGKIVAKPCHANTAKERKKLKAFRKMMDEGIMTLEQAMFSYNSHRGYILKNYNCHKTVRGADKLFHELFGWSTSINGKENF